MPIIRLRLGDYHVRPFEMSRWGRYVHLHLEAEKPVDVGVMDDTSLGLFRENKDHAAYGPNGLRLRVNGRISLPECGFWNLVIQTTPQKKSAPVPYRDAELTEQELIVVFFDLK